MGDFRYALEAREGFFESLRASARARPGSCSRPPPLTRAPARRHGSRHKHRLRAALALTAAFLVRRARRWPFWTGSLSLLADAVHMLVDAGGLLLSLVAIWFAERPATSRKTYGYYRVEILAALVNGVVLCLLALGILWQAYERLWAPPDGARRAASSSSPPVGLGVNLAPAGLLHAGAAREPERARAAYLEVLGDALSSAAVLVAGARHRAHRLDASPTPRRRHHRRSSSCRAPWRLLRQAVNVLLEAVPAAPRRRRDRGRRMARGAPACGASTICTCGRSPPGARP